MKQAIRNGFQANKKNRWLATCDLNEKNRMKKVLLFSFLFLFSFGAFAGSNLQLHYDFRGTIRGGATENYLTATYELFKIDKYGNTFMFVDFDFNQTKGSIGVIYTEIVRKFQIGNCPIMPHIEFNGGVGKGFTIANAYLAGASYGTKTGNLIWGASLLYKLNSFDRISHDAQITLIWMTSFLSDKLTLCGFLDIWSENINREKIKANSGKKLILITEPQIWYNINKSFSVGSEIEISYNFAEAKKTCVYPTLAVKWNF